MTSNPPTKHHYIPAFYLRRWAGGDGKVTEFTKPRHDIVARRIMPDRTGYQERLYELKGFEPSLAQQVEEKFFKPLDTWASNALTMLERHGHQAPWDSHSRSAWTRFLLSLLLRCPEDIEAFREWWHEDFSRTDADAEARYQAARGAEDPETFAEFLAGQPLGIKERHQFQVFYSLVDHDSVGGKINEMDWRVLQSPPAAPAFLTSDRPIIRTNGLDQEGDHIALPIGPRLLFGSPRAPFFLPGLSWPRCAAVRCACPWPARGRKPSPASAGGRPGRSRNRPDTAPDRARGCGYP